MVKKQKGAAGQQMVWTLELEAATPPLPSALPARTAAEVSERW